MYTYLATGLVAAALAATGAWQVQNWRFDSKEKERVEQELANQRLQAKAAIRREEQVITTQNESQARARALRLDAASARATADGLRVSTEAALRSAAASHSACIVRANTLGELLVSVEEAGRGMAEKADLHANDARTLTDAWPKDK